MNMNVQTYHTKRSLGVSFEIFLWTFICLFSSEVVFAQAPEQDCFNAIKVCQNVYVQNNAYQGFGQKQELGSNTCLSDNETNSSWYIFTVNKAGTLNIQISPSLANDDYDFAIFDLSNKSCDDIVNGTISPARCNYSSSQGNTGLKPGFSGTSESSAGPNQCAPMLVNVGETYALLINNFTSTAGGYTLNFTGTASIFDNQPPLMTLATASVCSPKTITLSFDENIQCASIAADGSDFVLSGPGSNTITGAGSVSCNSNSLTNNIVIKLNAAINIPGIYTITSGNGTDGNSILDICGNVLESGASIVFKVDFIAPIAKIPAFTDADCNVSNGTATASAVGGTAPYQYLWNTNPPQATKTVVNLLPGIYTVTITDANGCLSTANISIANKNAPSLKVLSAENLICKIQNTG
jgi:hypothetical protein